MNEESDFKKLLDDNFQKEVETTQKELEKDTRSLRIDDKLNVSGWQKEGSSKKSIWKEEIQLTDGGIVIDGRGGFHEGWSLDQSKKNRLKRADYVLYYGENIPIAVVEAKSIDHPSYDGIQQAWEYAEMLGVKFAYSTNGNSIIEYDDITKQQKTISKFPTADELWDRLKPDYKVPDETKESYLSGFNFNLTLDSGEPIKPRYYQERAINAALAAIYRGQKKILLTLATGTGKTYIAFQIAWNLSRTKIKENPKILFLADRTNLAEKAYDKDFAPFGNKRKQIQGKYDDAHIVYFSLYQSMTGGSDPEHPLWELYDHDFFDYIIIDECHRGAQGDSWKKILEHFDTATCIGMTATPKLPNGDNAGTYAFFDEPVYVYSLLQGLQDGFLAPHIVYSPIMDDQKGYTTQPGDVDKDDKPLTKDWYPPEDYDHLFFHVERQKKVAKYIIDYMKEKDIFYKKTIVFCRNQKHAAMLAEELRNYSKEGMNYAQRISSDERDAETKLKNFASRKINFPKTCVIATTSDMLTTGIDIPSLRLIVLDRPIDDNLNLLKQIVGRGTRVSTDDGKWWFTIIDFRGATRHLKDPNWDTITAEPICPNCGKSFDNYEILNQHILDEHTKLTFECKECQKIFSSQKELKEHCEKIHPKSTKTKQKHEQVTVENIPVEIVAVIQEIFDMSSGKPKVTQFTSLLKSATLEITSEMKDDLQNIWSDLGKRRTFKSKLLERRITPNMIKEMTQQYDYDVFDILISVSYDRLPKTRRQRADNVRRKKLFLEKPENAKQVLDLILEHYAEKGSQELELDQSKEFLDSKKFEEFGGAYGIIADIFNGKENFDRAITELLSGLYEDY